MVVIVFGPPIAGRSALARALERHLPDGRRVRAPRGQIARERIAEALGAGSIAIVEADLATAAERAEAMRAVRELGAAPLFVSWTCDPTEVRREVYRRYASTPRRFADHWYEVWQDDVARREPAGDEVPPTALVTVAARGSILDHVVRVAAQLGLPGAVPSAAPPARRVLVVDDESEARALMAETLQSLGCRVHAAADAKQALEIAEEEVLDLVITDQVMPGRSGIELAAELAQRYPDLHIALLTGHAEETVDDAVRTAGVELLLAKPAHASDLIRLLDELADRPEAE